jgi:hypothetical protein
MVDMDRILRGAMVACQILPLVMIVNIKSLYGSSDGAARDTTFFSLYRGASIHVHPLFKIRGTKMVPAAHTAVHRALGFRVGFFMDRNILYS